MGLFFGAFLEHALSKTLWCLEADVDPVLELFGGGQETWGSRKVGFLSKGLVTRRANHERLVAARPPRETPPPRSPGPAPRRGGAGLWLGGGPHAIPASLPASFPSPGPAQRRGGPGSGKGGGGRGGDSRSPPPRPPRPSRTTRPSGGAATWRPGLRLLRRGSAWG